MNPDAPKTPREEMEAWLTALLLGELSAGEAAAVRELMKHDAELAGLHERLRQSIALLREAVPHVEPPSPSAEPLRLSEERRKKLLAAFAIPPLKPATAKPRRQVRFRLIEVLAGLTIVALLAALFLPALSRSKSRSQLGLDSSITPLSRSRAGRESEEVQFRRPDRIGPELARTETRGEAVTATVSQDASGVRSPDVVGYINLPPAATNLVSVANSGQTLGKTATPVDALVSGGSANVRGVSDYQEVPMESRRKLGQAQAKPAAAEPLASPAPPVQIALPTAPADDVAGVAAQQLFQQNQGVGSAFSLGEPASVGVLEKVGDGASRPVEGADKQGTIGAALRGFYDDSGTEGVSNLGVAVGDRLAEGRGGTALRDAFGFEVAHASEPLVLMETTRTLPSRNATNNLGFGRFKSDELGHASESSVQTKAGAFAVTEPTTSERFYRLSGGQGGGGATGGEIAGRGITTAPFEPAEKAPVLGDSPVLGKIFRSESATEERRGRDVTKETVTASTQSLPGNPAYGAPQPAAGGLPATATWSDGALTSKPPAADFGTYDFFAAGGRIQPQQEAVGLQLADSSANVPAKPAGVANIALPTTPAPARKGAAVATGLPAEPALGAKLETQIAQKQRELETLRQKLAITDLDAAGAAPTPSIEAETYRRYKAALMEGEVKLIEMQAYADKLKKLSPAELVQVLPRVRQDPLLTNQLTQLNAAEQKLVALRRDLTEAHPDVARAQAQVNDLHQKVDSNVQAIMTAINTEVGRSRAEVEGLKKVVEQAQEKDIENAKISRPYYEKKRELELLYGLNRMLDTKLSAERIDLTIPRSSRVELVDRARPADKKSGFWRNLGVPVGGSYASTARVKVERDVTDIERVGGSRAVNGYDPYFVQTEFEAIQSESVLGKVVDDLGLEQAWAKDGRKLNKTEAVAELKAKLELKPVRNSSLVEIRATDGDADEAAKIANAVADAYTDHRAEARKALTLGGVKVLEDRSKEQQAKIEEVQKELAQLGEQIGIAEADASGKAPATAPVVGEDRPVIRKPSTNAPIPQPEIQTSENNFSTFSLNVSDVSFKLAMASLEKGQLPDAASIRSEEFINAFDYRDPEAAPGTPVAFAWERARWPFAHNRDLLRFSLKTAAAGRQAGRGLNLAVLLDNSGSMERADRVSILREALRVLAGQMQPQDKLSVITFARTPRLVADGIPGDKAGEVAEQVSGLTPQGGTNLEEAMNLAYQTALKHYLAGGINRVVLLTDGAANLGNVEPESLKQKVEAHRKQGVALDCFGIGWEGYNDDLLEVLSRNGDGRYGFINSPEEAASEFAAQLAGALKVAASDVKVQVEFNPKRVTSYRQIGYAKHQLTKEQFRDNTVDAAEIAAQEAGNALYTVEVNPAGDGPLCTVRCRFKIPGTTDYREQAWDVPFTGNALSLEQASPAMRLAGSAAAFAEWLVASPFAAEVTPDRVLGVMSGVPEVFGADSRPKKLEWMIRQAKGIEGK